MNGLIVLHDFQDWPSAPTPSTLLRPFASWPYRFKSYHPAPTDTLPARLLRLCCCEWTRHAPPSLSVTPREAVCSHISQRGCWLLFAAAAAAAAAASVSTIVFFSPSCSHKSSAPHPFSRSAASIHAAPLLVLSSHLLTGGDPGGWGWK